jgi:hypothetical protein
MGIKAGHHFSSTPLATIFAAILGRHFSAFFALDAVMLAGIN